MKNTKRSAFTIVELVIVIAVIAILSAVLIPTFGSIIESANKAVDTQLVAQINTVLAIEDVLGGGVNDAVEIQKVVKENGLKLQTKSKGQYIWYDIENKRVVLGGLDENGIVLDSEEPTAAVDANGPALISDTNVVTEIRKGQFNEDTTAPENFIKGYLFLSTESADNLAEIIYALRNPEGEDSNAIKASLNETLGKIKSEALKANLTAMLNTTAVMAKNGVTGFIGDNNSSVTRVIVSSEMTNISSNTINTILSYPNVVAVDFHSGVVSADADAITALKGRTEKPYFIYSGDELKKIDADNGDIAFLIHKNERGQYIKTVYVENVITGEKKSIAEFLTEDEAYEFSYNLGYEYLKGSATGSYDFVGYSFYNDGSNPLALGEHTHTLNSTEKLLIDANGNLTIYLVYERAASDFKIGNDYYSSKTTTRKLAKGEITSGTITVVSTNAVLDDSFGTELTIPSGVELLLPYQADYAKDTTFDLSSGSYNKANYLPGAIFNKDEMTGKTNLEIKGNVNLILQGSIYVDAAIYYAGTTNQCFITDNCGVLELAEGAKVTSTGFITAFGVIRGEGTIDAKSGTVDEIMSIYDWYGGSNAAVATGALGNNGGKIVTPFNNWKVENIRSVVTINPAVEYSARSGVYIDGTKPVDFLLTSSDANKAPLFVLSSDALIERSMSANGNVKITLKDGSASDTAKSLSVPDVALGIAATVNFTQTSLPLSHFDVCIDEGATLTLSNNIYKLLPGSNITVNGTLNINTEVVICNSFDLQFESFTTHTAYDNVMNSLIATSKYEHTYTSVSANGKSVTFSSQKMKGFNIFGIQRWEKDGAAVTKTATMPHTYPDEGAATLTVNGTLKFNSDGNANAKFAGEILGSKDATISVTGTVSGYTIEEGYYIAVSGAGGTWYDVHDPDQYGAAVLEGVNGGNAGTLAAGTYKYASVTQGNVTISGWQAQD